MARGKSTVQAKPDLASFVAFTALYYDNLFVLVFYSIEQAVTVAIYIS